MTRKEFFDWCKQQYSTEPEYPWNDWNAVLRRKDNNKWYAVVLEVRRDKLGLSHQGEANVLNAIRFLSALTAHRPDFSRHTT